MEGVYIIGIDLAKQSFQVHGACADGRVGYRKKLGRAGLPGFLAEQPRCVVAMEACAGAHYWGREIGKLGHEVRLMPPVYVKPYVKRHKNDEADAEAICEAATRATMRFVAVKSEAQQAQGMLYRTRDMLVGQRTQTTNALRSHLMEFGVVARQGPVGLTRLAAAVGGLESGLPVSVRELGEVYLERIAGLSLEIGELEAELRAVAKEDEETRRLMSIPGVGPITASAIRAFAPPMESFRRGRDFSAWLGLVPRQHSTGGKSRLGRVSKMGQRDVRRLLITGAMSVIRQAARRGAPPNSWLGRMMKRKPRMLVAVALANKMARIAWALTKNKEVYREPASSA